MTKPSLLLFAALAACAGKSTSATTTPATPTTTFELGEITLLEGPDAMIKVHANGTTELGYHHGSLDMSSGKADSDSLPIAWKPGPTFKADGTIEANAKPVLRVDADGTVTNLVDGKPLPFKVTADSITLAADGGNPGMTLTLAADGALQLPAGANVKPGKEPHVSGADTAGKRRVILTLIAFGIGGEVRTVSEPAAATPATPATPAP